MKELKIGMKGLILIAVIFSAISYGIATVFVTKPISNTMTVISGVDFAIYETSACVTPITSFTLGDVKRLQVVSKELWLKVIASPEISMKFSWLISSPDPDVTISMNMGDSNPTTMPVTLGAYFGTAIDGSNYLTEVTHIRLFYTIKSTATLGDSLNVIVSYTLNNPYT